MPQELGAIVFLVRALLVTIHFKFLNSQISSLASVVNSLVFNSATGIGNNVEGSSSFTENNFTIINSQVNSQADVITNVAGIAGDTNAVTIIGNNTYLGTANFSNNLFNISNSKLTSLASIVNNGLSGLNLAIGVGGDSLLGSADSTNNTITISDTLIDVTAQVLNSNAGTNIAVGFIATSGLYNLLNDTVNVTAIASGGSNTVASKIPGAATFNDATTTYNINIFP